MKERLHFLDLARGIAIVLIVWAHYDTRMDHEFFRNNLEAAHDCIYSFHVALLFIISAALMRKALDGRSLTSTAYIKKIAQRILVPFYSLNLAFLVVNIVTPKSLSNPPSPTDMLLAMTIMQSDNDKMPSGVLWFLFTLFLCHLVLYLLVNKLSLSKYTVMAVCLGLYIASPLFKDVYILSLDRFTRNLLFYAFGYLFSEYIITKLPSERSIYILVFGLGWLSAFSAQQILMDNWNYIAYYIHIFTGIFGSITVIMVCVRLHSYMDNQALRLLHSLGERSMLIYVLHMPVLVLLKKPVYYFGLQSSYAGFITCLAAGVAISLLIGSTVGFNKTLYQALFGRMPSRPYPARNGLISQ